MAHFLLIYDLADDYLERRPRFRAEHLALARAAADRGELVMGGALDPAERALLLFAGEDDSAARAFAGADPYVANGMVAAWQVMRWNTVVGPGAANPLR